jgi:hypothetical protein
LFVILKVSLDFEQLVLDNLGIGEILTRLRNQYLKLQSFFILENALSRMFYMKSGPVSQDNIDDANAIIKGEVEELEKNYRE